MNTDSELKETLHMAVSNAVSRMEILQEPADRRCLFHEYKEWLREDVSDEIWAIPANWNHEWLDTGEEVK